MRRDTLTITSQQAGHPITKTIYLKHLTGIAPSTMGDSIAVIYHGDSNHLYLSEAETLDMIGKTWAIRNCRFYRVNGCWGARQTSGLPPAGCIGCQLRKIVLDRTREDLRASLPDKPRSPLCVALWGSLALMLGSWLIIQPYNKAAEAAEYWRRRAIAAEAKATFKREGKHR